MTLKFNWGLCNPVQDNMKLSPLLHYEKSTDEVKHEMYCSKLFVYDFNVFCASYFYFTVPIQNSYINWLFFIRHTYSNIIAFSWFYCFCYYDKKKTVPYLGTWWTSYGTSVTFFPFIITFLFCFILQFKKKARTVMVSNITNYNTRK